VKVSHFISLYAEDSLLHTLQAQLSLPENRKVFIKGLCGSADAVLVSALYTHTPQTILVVLDEREEAEFFKQDMYQLLGDTKVLFFPSSSKRPYHYEEINNANVLQRAETLSVLAAHPHEAFLVVTYSEALAEKVINKKSLSANTYQITVGSKPGLNLVAELLSEYQFERTDFVYEPGQYAVRGGIIDVFSYSADLPFRIEFYGDEVESIRTFHPETQLSVDARKSISLVPDVQTRFGNEDRVPLVEFLPKNIPIWVQDYSGMTERIDIVYDKALKAYNESTQGEGINILRKPETLFETAKTFKITIEGKQIIEFGYKAKLKSHLVFDWVCSEQTKFAKNFDSLSKNLLEHQLKGYQNILCSDNPKQLERLQTIFLETNKEVTFAPLYVALRGGFEDHILKLVVYTDHQIFERFLRYKQKERFSKSKSMTLRELKSLQPGDYVTHIDYGVGRFAGLQQVEVNAKMQEAITLIFRDNDVLTVSVHSLHKISKYSGQEGQVPSLSKIGSGEWETKKRKVKSKVRDIAKELIGLYAKRKLSPGFKYSPDSYLQAELESSFLYEDTVDQAKACVDTKADMEKSYPMDRLVCGDVGFGKTEVAIRAAFKAATDGKQVAVLVPTTILAKQHWKSFRDRLGKFPVTIDYISRARTAKEISKILADTAAGKIDILIGTHRIVSKDVQFKSLGLMVIDEEQKFGVKTKDRLKELRYNVDCLTLTATPIPRTLQFSLMSARDLSIINTPPANRQPVTTEIHIYEEAFIRDAIVAELKRGGQVFFIHNRINELEEQAAVIKRLVPDAKIAILHGQTEDTQKENVMDKFENGDYDILLSTSIIESGIDIPNANTMIINRAHMFGLSDLHQMRGRVGRSNKKAYAFMLCPPVHLLTNEARKRLRTLEEFSDLGDGFKVAMRDLDIRGAGDLLGAEQSGFINDLGFEAYHKILDEAVSDLKETEFRELFQTELNEKALLVECNIETDLELLIPDTYVTSISERLSLYSQLDNLKDETGLSAFRNEVADRFGPIPPAVDELIRTVHLRWLAQRAGFERLQLKNGILRGFFVPAEREVYFQGETFGKILNWVQQHSKRSRLKDSKGKLSIIIDSVSDVAQGITLLEQILAPIATLA